jgi:cell wall-associated NlpC family hydrolase
VAFARAQLGKPYVFGGTGPGAYDCSGLTQAAWKAAGVSIPRTATAQMQGLPAVSGSAAQPGDLVFFYGNSSYVDHVGMYIGNGLVIHAPHPGASVEIVAVSTMPLVSYARP